MSVVVTLPDGSQKSFDRPVTVGEVTLDSPLMLAAGLVKGDGFESEEAALAAVERGDNIIPGWKLLIQKAATQPPPVTNTPLVLVTPTETKYPTAIPFYTVTPTVTATVQAVPLGQQIKQNSTVVAALLIAFSVLLAGIIGFGRKKQ